MTYRQLKVGQTTKNGYIIASILGQGPNGAVFTTENREIRWSYYANEGVLPDRLGVVVARFDKILIDIKENASGEYKKHLIEMAGKCLYLALNNGEAEDPSFVFLEVERRLEKISEKKPLIKKKHKKGRRSFCLCTT